MFPKFPWSGDRGGKASPSLVDGAGSGEAADNGKDRAGGVVGEEAISVDGEVEMAIIGSVERGSELEPL